MVDVIKLAAHLIADPDARGFSGMDIDQVAADLKVVYKNRNRSTTENK